MSGQTRQTCSNAAVLVLLCCCSWYQPGNSASQAPSTGFNGGDAVRSSSGTGGSSGWPSLSLLFGGNLLGSGIVTDAAATSSSRGKQQGNSDSLAATPLLAAPAEDWCGCFPGPAGSSEQQTSTATAATAAAATATAMSATAKALSATPWRLMSADYQHVPQRAAVGARAGAGAGTTAAVTNSSGGGGDDQGVPTTGGGAAGQAATQLATAGGVFAASSLGSNSSGSGGDSGGGRGGRAAGTEDVPTWIASSGVRVRRPLVLRRVAIALALTGTAAAVAAEGPSRSSAPRPRPGGGRLKITMQLCSPCWGPLVPWGDYELQDSGGSSGRLSGDGARAAAAGSACCAPARILADLDLSSRFAGGQRSLTILLSDDDEAPPPPAGRTAAAGAAPAVGGAHAGAAAHAAGFARDNGGREDGGVLFLRPLQPLTGLLIATNTSGPGETDGTAAAPDCGAATSDAGDASGGTAAASAHGIWAGRGGSAGTWTLGLEYVEAADSITAKTLRREGGRDGVLAMGGPQQQTAVAEAGPEAPAGPAAVFSAVIPAAGNVDSGGGSPDGKASGISVQELGNVPENPWGIFVATAAANATNPAAPPAAATPPAGGETGQTGQTGKTGQTGQTGQSPPSPPPFHLSRWTLRLCGCHVPGYARLASLLLPLPRAQGPQALLLPQQALLLPPDTYQQAGLGLLGWPRSNSSGILGSSSSSGSNGACWWPVVPAAAAAGADPAAEVVAAAEAGAARSGQQGAAPQPAAAVLQPAGMPQQSLFEAVAGQPTAPLSRRGETAPDAEAADLGVSGGAQAAPSAIAAGSSTSASAAGEATPSTGGRWESALSAAAEMVMAQQADAGGGLGAGGAAFGMGTALANQLRQRAAAVATSLQQRRQSRPLPGLLLPTGWAAQMQQAVRRLRGGGRLPGSGRGGGGGGSPDQEVDLEAKAGLPYVLQVAALCHTDLYLCYNTYFRVEPSTSVTGSSAAAPEPAAAEGGGEAGGGAGEGGGGGEYSNYGYESYGYDGGGGGGYGYDELVAGEAGNVGGSTIGGPGEIGAMDMGQSADEDLDPGAAVGVASGPAASGMAEQQSAAAAGGGGFDQWLAAFEARVQDRYHQHYAPRAVAAFTKAEQQLAAALASWPDVRAGGVGGTPAQRQQARQLRSFLNARLYAAAYRSAQLSYASAYLDAVIGLALYGKIAELAINPRFIITRLLLIVLDGAVATSLLGLTQATFTVTPTVVGGGAILNAPNSTASADGSNAASVSSNPAGGAPILASPAASNLLTSAATTAAASRLLPNASPFSTQGTAALRDSSSPRSSLGTGGLGGAGSNRRGSRSSTSRSNPLLARLQNTSRGVLTRATQAMTDASTAYPAGLGMGAAAAAAAAAAGRAGADGTASGGIGLPGPGTSGASGAAVATPWLDAAEQVVSALAAALRERPASVLSAARGRLHNTVATAAAATTRGPGGLLRGAAGPRDAMSGGRSDSSAAGSSQQGLLQKQAVQAFTAALDRFLQRGEQATVALQTMQQQRTAVLGLRQQALVDTAARMAAGGVVPVLTPNATASANGTDGPAAGGGGAAGGRSGAPAAAGGSGGLLRGGSSPGQGPLALAAGAGLSAITQAATVAAARVRERWGPLLLSNSSSSSSRPATWQPPPAATPPAPQDPPLPVATTQTAAGAPGSTGATGAPAGSTAGGVAGAAAGDPDVLVWSVSAQRNPPSPASVLAGSRAGAVTNDTGGKQHAPATAAEEPSAVWHPGGPSSISSPVLEYGDWVMANEATGRAVTSGGGRDDESSAVTWVPEGKGGSTGQAQG